MCMMDEGRACVPCEAWVGPGYAVNANGAHTALRCLHLPCIHSFLTLYSHRKTLAQSYIHDTGPDIRNTRCNPEPAGAAPRARHASPIPMAVTALPLVQSLLKYHKSILYNPKQFLLFCEESG
jgi:hypothetical protein